MTPEEYITLVASLESKNPSESSELSIDPEDLMCVKAAQAMGVQVKLYPDVEYLDDRFVSRECPQVQFREGEDFTYISAGEISVRDDTDEKEFPVATLLHLQEWIKKMHETGRLPEIKGELKGFVLYE